MKNYDNKPTLPHIGKIISRLTLEKSLNKDDILAYLNINESMLENIYDSPSVDIQTLINFSNLLQTNLFIYYRDHSLIENLFDDCITAQEIEQKNETIAHLTAIIAAQKKIISFYEANETVQSRTKQK
ncbi:hypothetical protein [Chryseobacterium tongliaoense]|uniref:hypothetical protein n=1 Tax=Chryseobacterium tongliaoense TaxID=3240933 RepID=UPI0035111593